MGQINKDSLDVSVELYIIDDTDGTPETGVLWSTAGIDLNFRRDGAVVTSITEKALGTPALTDAHDDGGFLEVGNGRYRLDVPDAAFATGVPQVTIGGTVTGMVVLPITIQLVDEPATAASVANIGAGSGGAVPIEASYDNTTTDTIDNAAAVDKGGGLVGIPVTGHAFTAGREVTIAGTTNYNGAHTIVSETTNEVVITDTYNAEAFAGSETIVASVKGVVFVGTVTSGTYADTTAANGTPHSMDDVGNAIDIVYAYSVGGSFRGTTAPYTVNLNSNSDEIAEQVYDHVGAAWDTLRTISGSGGGTYVSPSPAPAILAKHTGTGTELGMVYLRFQTLATSPNSLAVDELLVSAQNMSTSVGYPDGAYWVKSVAKGGTAGQEIGTNGTVDNPCPWADALVMNASQPLNRFHIANGDTVTLTDDIDDFTLFGSGWLLVLAGYSIDGAHITGAVSITGTGTNGSIKPEFHDCCFGAVTLPASGFKVCGFGLNNGTFTGESAGNFFFHLCKSDVPGGGAPNFVFSGLGSATTIENRGFLGGGNYTLDSDCTMSHEVLAGGITTVTTGGAEVRIRGTCDSVVLVLSGASTVKYVGTTGPIVISGTATTVVDLEGVGYVSSDTSVNATINSSNLLNPEHITDDWEAQSQADPTGFHTNVKELDGSAIQQDGGYTKVSSGTVKLTDASITTATFAVGAINAAALGADAITAAKIADDAFVAANFATGALETEVVAALKATGIVLTTATIETVTSQTQLVIPATADPPNDNAINGALAVIIDGTDPNQRSIRLVTDYDAGTRTVTIELAADFTVTTADTIVILATSVQQDRTMTG